MAKIIAILNHKGGVGKTTTSINLAAALQQKKKRVMVIDLDGQANLTESFGYSIEEEKTVYGALKGEYALPLIKTESGITLVPSCLDLSAAESELINEPGREMILRGLIAKLPEAEKFDYILIDCPPSLGLLTLNALTAADYSCAGSVLSHAWNGQNYERHRSGTRTSQSQLEDWWYRHHSI